MLQAINSNKAGRSISSNEMHWRQLFKASEDSLTSTIIGLLFYLPHELTWHILTNACYGTELPTPNQVLSKEYWPIWDSEGTRNSRLVEPDVFIRTTSFDLIVEAKRYDYHQQSEAQWLTEFRAYLNEYGEEKKQVFLLALGGINSESTQTLTLEDNQLTVIMCRWERLLIQSRKALEIIKNSKQILNVSASAANILEDILLGFNIHGYMVADWFSDTPFIGLSIKSSSLAQLSEEYVNRSMRFGFEDLANFRIDKLILDKI